MNDAAVSEFERRKLIGSVVTALELVPETALFAVRNALERHEATDPISVQKATGLSGQSLDSLLLLLDNTKMGRDVLLIAVDTAITVAQNAKKNSETIDLSWTGPAQFAVEGRTTPSVLEDMVKNAKTGIIVTGYSITRNAAGFIESLGNAADRNVRIIIVLHEDGKSRNFDTLSRLWTGRKKPLVYSRRPGPSDAYFKIHAKMVVVDSRDLLVTSANLTRHGLTNNFEIGLRVRGKTARRAEELVQSLIDRRYLEQEEI